MENSQELEELKSLWTVQQNECKEKIIEEDNDLDDMKDGKGRRDEPSPPQRTMHSATT